MFKAQKSKSVMKKSRASQRDSIRYEGEERTTEELENFKKRMIEDERMDSIFRMGENLTEKFDNRAYLHPHGMTDFDYKGIPENRRDEFEKFKYNTRHEIYQYMSEHYEVDALLALFFKKLLVAKPQDAIHFAAEYFTKATTESEFKTALDQEKERLSRYRVAKMRAAEKITTIAAHEGPKIIKDEELDPCAKKDKKKDKREDFSLDPLEATKLQEGVLNWLKKLNIGPLAQDFDAHEKVEPVVEIKPAPKKHKKPYCGCKDPGVRERAHPKKRPIKPKPQPSQLPIPSTEVTAEIEKPAVEEITNLETDKTHEPTGPSNEKQPTPVSSPDMEYYDEDYDFDEDQDYLYEDEDGDYDAGEDDN